MAIDTTPSTVATNALDALDFSSLIGGPMDAIIKAQALAAKTTYEFINEVGLTTDPDTGEKKPVNVTFQYNSGGKVATLTVPLLVILTVPNIEVSNFVIDFIANISASSSSTEETSSDTELGVDAEAEASLGIGPFSIKVKAKANYSSKQHSKASQESKYSVEYTMNVRVEGGQSDMPAGLQTVLSILQGSNTSVGPDEMVVSRPKNINMDGTDKTTLEIVLKDAQGYLAAGTTVVLNLEDTPFDKDKVTVMKGYTIENVLAARKYLSTSAYSKNSRDNSNPNPKHLISPRIVKPFVRRFNEIKTYEYLANNTDKVEAVTDESGSVVFQLVLKEKLNEDQQGSITVISSIPISDVKGEASFKEEITKVPYTILIPSEKTGSIILSSPEKSGFTLTSTSLTKTVGVSIKDNEGNPVSPDIDVDYEIYDSSKNLATTAFKKDSENKTSVSGASDFKVELQTPIVKGTYNLKISTEGSTPLQIPITVS
ncbi:DUF2589 domain-containing protein [Psychroserpens mesophilus]|uniref:DUF2589 domain-containing protein n=1 Tax=Psychroserpens mesophilus TaxID=325473 RepID=UPI000693B85A|nr:DUF2589 domain-containing protein [Psychroserpens mesophilus]